MNLKKTKAFTLIEMMAVVVIIGILAAVIGPRVFNNVTETQKVRAEQDIANLKKAVVFFRLHTNKLPQDLRELVKDPDIKGWRGPYMERLPKDPWDNNYEFRAPGNDNRDFDIWTLGADNREGGEGENQDIQSWVDEE